MRSVAHEVRLAEEGFQSRGPIGEGQGQRARQGGTPLPGDQALVRAREGPLPRTREEHGAAKDPVRPVEPVDGPRKDASTGWISPPGEAGCGLKRPNWRPWRAESARPAP
jgi:hypothetical protein